MAKNVDEDYLLSGRSSNTGHRKTVVVYTISVSNRSCVNSPFPSLITKFEFYATLVIITTNLEFPKWTEVLLDDQMTAALLDRLTHRAHILNINGESYRFKQALTQQANMD